MDSFGESSWVNVDNISIGYKAFLGNARWPILTEQSKSPTSQLSLNMDFNAIDGALYWKNELFGLVDDSSQKQFRTVSWELELGVRVTKHIDIHIGHRSQHLMDAAADGLYPEHQWIGFRWHIFTNRKYNTIFKAREPNEENNNRPVNLKQYRKSN